MTIILDTFHKCLKLVMGTKPLPICALCEGPEAKPYFDPLSDEKIMLCDRCKTYLPDVTLIE